MRNLTYVLIAMTGLLGCGEWLESRLRTGTPVKCGVCQINQCTGGIDNRCYCVRDPNAYKNPQCVPDVSFYQADLGIINVIDMTQASDLSPPKG